MFFKLLIANLLALFIYSNAIAGVKIVENYCNDQAQIGAWEQGIKDKKHINDIVKAFDPEHQQTVSFLNKLQVITPESTLLKGMARKPENVVRLMEDSPRFQWEIAGNKSKLGIIVHYYKGCISQISLAEIKNGKMNFFSRSNKLSTRPLLLLPGDRRYRAGP